MWPIASSGRRSRLRLRLFGFSPLILPNRPYIRCSYTLLAASVLFIDSTLLFEGHI